MIELRDLTVYYGAERALGPISGGFGAGTLAVAGPAQSGKTTLLKAMCGLLSASGGSVRLEDRELAEASSEELAALRAQFGMVFQNDALFDSMDALANVALPLLRREVAPAEARRRAREALQQVGLGGQEQALPERLSGGMRKRLGLARAIVARPRFLLADDPLAGLDPGTSVRVLDLLFELWRGRGGLIIASADPGLLWERCDEVLVLDRGEVVARGPAAEVRRHPRVRPLFGEGEP